MFTTQKPLFCYIMTLVPHPICLVSITLTSKQKAGIKIKQKYAPHNNERFNGLFPVTKRYTSVPRPLQ